MTFVSGIKGRIKDKLRTMIRSEVDKTIDMIFPQLLDYYNSPPETKQSFHDHTKDPVSNYSYYVELRNRLEQLKVKVEDISIDIHDFKKWLQAYPEIDAAYTNSADAHIEKCLEHYLSFTLMGLSSTDTFVDIAAAGSTFSALLRRRLGLKAYRLDLSYPKGIHGYDIGGDAGETGLPEGFATAMALHCAYECFMGDADMRFINEATRILKPGGRFIILPLYLDKTYFISTSPFCNQKEITIDAGAARLWRDDSYKVPFSRHYSPESFAERIYSLVPSNMKGTVYFLTNLSDVSKSFVGQRIYCYFAFFCSKSE
ncbi:MAG: hypothetical protein ABFD75_00015 [Smithella sp.]